MDRESSPVQLALFRYTIGPAALRVMNGFTYSPNEDRGDWQVSLARSCNFRACLEENLIRGRIVVGLRDSAAVKRLLKLPKLTLKQCIDICWGEEAAEKHIKTPTTKEDYGLCKVAAENRTHLTAPCRFCGRIHLVGRINCPAWGKNA
ncbi:unnamed protein product [Echinostoma caproni]|uniref:Zf-RVT domain-containing protein n=1 Tax=Echinostoma caproni TaxID=27848 RepID=A0A182ZZH3_9TREM|nr:unnamed protein product [Echinostoma caproni]